MISTRGKSGIFFADRLMSILASVETPDWVWFEEGLAYDNARLPQALMLAGMATQTPEYVEAGLRSLALADDAANRARGPFPPHRHRRFRRAAATSPSLRPAARGSNGDDLGLPHGMAGGRRCRLEGRRNACLRMVSRQQRPVRGAGRSVHRKLPRWAASRSR